MMLFGFGVAVGAAVTWAVIHFAVVAKLKAELELKYTQLEALGARVVRKF